VGWRDGSEAFLASSVPNLSLDSAARFERDRFGGELYAYCGVFVFRKHIFNVSGENMCFTDPSVSNQYDYKVYPDWMLLLNLRLNRKL
jgi:hypothetical protein